MTPEQFNHHAQHFFLILSQPRTENNKDIENDVPGLIGQGTSDEAAPVPTTESSEIVNRMEPESTTQNAKKVIIWIIALYAVLVYLLLIAIDAIRQIHDLDSFMLHTPVILIGFGLLGSIHTAARRNNWPLLIWFSVVLWMLGLWT
jgi:hypothetical protein